MPVATSELMETAKRIRCESLGIEHLEVEPHYDYRVHGPPGQTRVLPWRVFWIRDGAGYETIIDARTKIVRAGMWPFKYDIEVEDTEAMTRIAERVIRDARHRDPSTS